MALAAVGRSPGKCECNFGNYPRNPRIRFNKNKVTDDTKRKQPWVVLRGPDVPDLRACGITLARKINAGIRNSDVSLGCELPLDTRPQPHRDWIVAGALCRLTHGPSLISRVAIEDINLFFFLRPGLNPSVSPENDFSKFKIRSNARRASRASRPGRWEHPCIDSMQTFPCRFSKGGIGSNDVTDHLPSGEIQRTLGRGSHGKRHRTLRAETDSLRGRFLAWTYSYSLREQIDSD
jgi:hypothetical protein